jgi:predicted signal transduction protein with EAL and GGDEF domain
MLSFRTSRRLNAQRWHLALAIAALTFLGMLLHDAALLPLAGSEFWRRGSFLLPAVMVGVASYWNDSRLQGSLGGLRPNAEACAVDGSDAAAEMAPTDTITACPTGRWQNRCWRGAGPRQGRRVRAAILFIGLDGLKQVHRAMGQDACNELLKQAGQRLLVQGLRRCHKMLQRGLVDVMGKPGDRLPVDAVLCHLAGGEFVAILPGHLDRAALALTCEGIINAMAEPFQVHSHEVRVEASVGIAMTPEDACNRVYLLAFAAQAMWAAKRSGKLRYAFFDRQGLEGQLAQLQIEGELQHALARGELVLHYQPQVELDSCEQRAVEALVRWQHPVRGLLAPSAFIDAAERGGLMAELGRRSSDGVTQCRRWRKVCAWSWP